MPRINKFLFWMFPGILALVSAMLVAGIANRSLCRTPLTTDEQAYIFQANTFLDGAYSRPCPLFAPLLSHNMIIMESEAGWVSRYPPGHALFLTPGIWMGDPYYSVFAGAAVGLLLTALAAAFAAGGSSLPRIRALAAAALLTASPWFLFTFATLLSHTSGFVATAGLLAFYLWWRNSGRALPALLAGLAWGFLCINRTYTAILLALPFALDALWALARARNARTLRGLLLFAGGAAAGAAALMFYNMLILGHPLKMTYLYYEPLEALGFGKRHYGMHTWSKGLKILKNNLLLADKWIWGFPGGLLIWLGLLIYGRGWRNFLTLAVPVLAVPAGYVFFSHRGPHETGPGYFFEILPFIIAGASMGIARLWNSPAPRTSAARRWAALALVLLVLAGPLRFSVKAAYDLRKLIEPRRALLACVASAPENSLVFTSKREWTGDHPMDFAVFNPHGLKSQPLIMHEAGGAETAPARYFKNNAHLSPYKLIGGAAPEFIPLNPDAPYSLAIETKRSHRQTGTNSDADGCIERIATAGRDRKGMLAFGNYRFICPGCFTAYFDMDIKGAGGAPAACLDISSRGGRRILAERQLSTDCSGEQKVDFTVDEYISIEPRVYYKGRGNIRLKSIRITERQ